MVMDMDISSHPSCFEYRGIDVFLPGACVNNRLHAYLFRLGQQRKRLYKFNCPHPQPMIGSDDVRGISLDGAPLDTWIAKCQALFLAQGGIQLPAGFVNDHRESLVSSYLLGSSLCVAETKSGGLWEYSFVTKSPEILRAHEDQLAPTDRKKGFDRFSEQLSTSYKELSSGSYATVRLFADVDGVRLSKRTLGVSSSRFIFPYYGVNSFAMRLKNALERQKVRLTYRDTGGLRPPLVTTLDTGVVASWLGTTPTKAEMTKWADWSSSASMGYMSLPDLSHRGQFVSVPILHIEKMERC